MPNAPPHAYYPFFFFNDTATTEIYTLSLHDALPISPRLQGQLRPLRPAILRAARLRQACRDPATGAGGARSEEHTSELQSQSNLVCRLLLEKKKNRIPDALPRPSPATVVDDVPPGGS